MPMRPLTHAALLAAAGLTPRARSRGPVTRFAKAPTELPNNSVTRLSGAKGGRRYFRIKVPEGCTYLVIWTLGGGGNADVYVKRGGKPTPTSWDYRLRWLGNHELVHNPAATDWYVMVHGRDAFTGVTLLVSYG
jgi:hypothetical protein